MSESDEGTEAVGESAISGDRAAIPASIRERADIEDGDTIRWQWQNGELSVEVVRQRTGVFADFDGFEGGNESLDHVDLEPAGEFDSIEGADRLNTDTDPYSV
jgi:hypothetical protein